MNDLKYAFRSLLKRPGFTLVAIITLALGMGAATAIFSVVNAVLLRPAPYPHAERLVEIREVDERGRGMPVCEPNYNDLAARSQSFEAMARYTSWTQAVAGGHEPQRINAAPVSGDFFRVLGVAPITGRFFFGGKPEEVAVVSYGFWKRQLGAPANLDGQTLRFSNKSFAIIGVLPPELEFPSDTDVWYPVEIYPPNTSRSGHNWKVIGRLKENVAPEQARAEIAMIGQQLKREYGREIDAVSFAALPLRERSVQNVRGILFVLCGAVGLLLAIASSNVANLLLVRATVRRKEIALRVALGASTARLARQFIMEALLLTLAGGALGALLSFWGVELIVGLYCGNLPQVGKIGIDQSVLLFSLGIAVLLGLILGLVPSLHASQNNLQTDLQDTSRGSSASRTSTRNVLIAGQVALTLMLLVGAGLIGRSFQRLLAVNPGFVAQSAVAMTVSMPDPDDLAAKRKLAQSYQQLLVRLEAMPGVMNVGAIDALPLSGEGSNGRFLIEEGGVTVDSMEAFSKKMTELLGTNRLGDAQHRVASAGYFSTMHIPLLRGRLFQESDGPDNPHVAVVSETLARRYFADSDPIGKQIQFGNMDGDLHLLNVIGVVGDVRDKSLDAEVQPTVYVNFVQRGSSSDFSFIVRGRGAAESLIEAMRKEARAANPEMPIKFQTIEQIVSSSLDSRRFSMVMLGVFAGAALLLAMVGLYGIMSYITSQRTTEIGIRMALGAQRGEMLRLILRQSLILVGAGMIAGIALSLGASRLLGSFLFGIGAADFATYGSVMLLLALAALAASYFPARRAMRVDPMIALRHE